MIQALKKDKAGFEAPASAIAVASGQLWSNIVDDFILKLYALNAGLKEYGLQTVGAVGDQTVIATLDTNGQVWRIRGVATGRTATQGEVASVRFEGTFYRNGGTVFVLDPIHSVTTTGALAGVDVNLGINGDDVEIQATGIGGKTVDWTVKIYDSVEVV